MFLAAIAMRYAFPISVYTGEGIETKHVEARENYAFFSTKKIRGNILLALHNVQCTPH